MAQIDKRLEIVGLHPVAGAIDQKVVSRGSVYSLDEETGFYKLRLPGVKQGTKNLYYGNYEIGGFLMKDGTFDITHRVFIPVAKLGKP